MPTNNFIATYSGGRFYFDDIMANDINIQDIAHALSHLCRFGGHVEKFYSVAQHSVLVSHLAPPEHALAALLHDATEAYVQDLVYPVKVQLSQYRDLEEIVEKLICTSFCINTKHPLIKVADTRALYAEAMHFFGNVEDWNLEGFECEAPIEFLSPQLAKELFLERYLELT